MTSILIAILGTCFAYQANRFRKAGMHLFALAFCIPVNVTHDSGNVTVIPANVTKGWCCAI